MTVALDAVLLAVSRHSLRRWLLALGGFGLIPLGLLDSSIIPVPGSMDLLTIILSARQQSLWFYYAFMATAGSVLGALLTYKVARKGGKETLHRRLRHWRMDKVREMFARWGFSTVAVPALMPPPVPMVPFVLAAGAMQYPAKKFLTAMITGRVVRYTVLAYLASRYGRRILHPGPAIWVAFGILAAAAFLALYLWHEIRSPGPIED